MTDIFCPVCGSSNSEVQSIYRGKHASYIGMNRVHCLECGLVFADPMPDLKALEEYNASYFASAHGGKPHNNVTLSFFKAIANLRLAHIRWFVDKHKIAVSNVLEVGPGPGFFARKWLDLYPETNYLAIESDTSCYESLKNIGVSIINNSEPIDATHSVDMVVMSHVLEHVSDPLIFITEMTEKLRVGGILFIEVPCTDYKHKNIDEPHLLFFDKIPMHALLSRLSFDNIHLSYHGQSIEILSKTSVISKLFNIFRSRLISIGFITPFARQPIGMEILADPLERAIVAPFKAHRESQEPSWWLRALAVKK